MTSSEGHARARLQRALAVGNLIAAEQAAFEVPFVSLASARALLELYAERGDPKYERAALRYLRRYIDEANPSLADVVGVAAVLGERAMLMQGRKNRAARPPQSSGCATRNSVSPL